jgi:undecaprenyl-diphosphatase
MIKYLFLGIIQGLTEFLPISSSGHLVIMQKILGLSGQEVILSVILHLGTTLALILFFFKDILKVLSNRRELLWIIIVTLITGIIGISGKEFFEVLFSSVNAVAIALIITGAILILTRGFMEGKRNNLQIKDAIILGLAQGVAIIPGISRSGITISTLLFRGLDKGISFKFSFLASIPAILGALLLEAREINSVLKANLINFTAGFIFSFLTGLISLGILKFILQRAKFYYFGYYCIIVAIVTLLFVK